MPLLIFVLLPLAELYVLVQLGQEIGFWATLGLLLAAGFIGSFFARREGLRVWTEYQRAALEGREPTEGVLDGVLVLLGGALLIAPGLLTDVVGVLLLVPWTRHAIAAAIRRHHARSGQSVFVKQTFVSGAVRRSRSPGVPSVIDTTGESADERARSSRGGGAPPALP